MPAFEAQQFLRDLDKRLRPAADHLPANPDAAVYKHAVLRSIFLNSADYGGEGSVKYLKAIRSKLEEREYNSEENVSRVPAPGRWKTLQDSAPLLPGTKGHLWSTAASPAAIRVLADGTTYGRAMELRRYIYPIPPYWRRNPPRTAPCTEVAAWITTSLVSPLPIWPLR